MYTPAHFVETDLVKLHAAIEAYSFATLVCQHAGSSPPLIYRSYSNGIRAANSERCLATWLRPIRSGNRQRGKRC